MQTIKFKIPNDDRIHSVDIDDDLYDTWEEVTIDGEDLRVNVWYDDPKDGILVAVYPYTMVDGDWETDYCDFERCELVNGEDLKVQVPMSIERVLKDGKLTEDLSEYHYDECQYEINRIYQMQSLFFRLTGQTFHPELPSEKQILSNITNINPVRGERIITMDWINV